MRLQHAIAKHQALREMARLRTPAAAVDLTRMIQLMIDSNPTAFDSFRHGGHSNASHKLRAADPVQSGFEYARDQLPVAAAVIAAELEVPRKLHEYWVAYHIASFFVAPNMQSVGIWQGRSLGLIRVVAALGAFNGVRLYGTIVTHTGWGLSSRSNKAR